MNDRRCFIVGMGPSLHISDLDALHNQNEISLGCNKCYLAFDKTAWRPSHYFVTDMLLAETLAERIASISQEIPTFSYDVIGSHIRKYPNNVNFCAINRNFDDNPGLQVGYSVVNSMLHFAFQQRFNPIYLIGVDFSYNYDTTRVVKRRGSCGTVDCVDMSQNNNYFIEGYVKKGELQEMPKTKQQIPFYENAYRQCQSVGIEVYNASRHTALEVFPRVNLDEVLS